MLWHRLFKSEDSRFMLSTAFKLVGILLFVTILVVFDLIQYIRVNYLFLKANGFVGVEELKQAYFDFILSDLRENLIYIFIFFNIVFFLGLYIGKLLLRPFKNIGEYCQKVIDHPDEVYVVDQFSDYRLLTRFSEQFFNHLRDCRHKKKLEKGLVSPVFMGIHKPVLDRIFLFHFSFLMIIVCVISTWALIANALSIYDQVVEMALRTTKGMSPNFHYFIGEQNFIVNELALYVILLMVVFYFILAIHLYNQVSGAAFGIFSTMRSYMKGSYQNRVHLVGYSYLREYTRQLNKYLDYMNKNFNSEHNGH